MQRGQRAVGHTVLKNVRGGDAAGFIQLSLSELVGSLRRESPVKPRQWLTVRVSIIIESLELTVFLWLFAVLWRSNR